MAGAFVDSYDPRAWAATWQPPVAEPTRNMGARLAGGRLLSLGVAGALLATGALSAWLSRTPRASETVAVTADASGALPAVEPTAGEVRRTLVLSRSADLGDALAALGLPADLIGRLLEAALPAVATSGDVRAVVVMTPGTQGTSFDRLELSNTDSSGVIVRRLASGELQVSSVGAQLSTRIVVQHGTMDGDSFYSSAIAAGIPNSVIPVFAKALAFDFNFQTEVAAGDAFEAAYRQQVNAAGDAVGTPELVYASLTTASKAASVYRVDDPAGGEDQWFDSAGRSIVRSLMRTPVDGARVSSKFGMRFHPVLHFAKLHGGIDFAAPIGTPIYAAGTGVIEFAAPKGPNGNFVALRHDNGWRTLYLHLNRFADGIAPGVRVNQGQHIGDVGTTGRSTGPHLHYEVHIDGEKVDPLSIPVENSGRTLSGAELIAFEKTRDQIDSARAGQGG